LAEVMLTRLASGYVPSGMGLSFWTAGKSVESAWDFTARQYLHFQCEAHKFGPLKHNI
jgi:hypothetical protein